MEKPLHIPIDTDVLTCESCGLTTTNVSEVLQTLETLGVYDEETGEFVEDSGPVPENWELVIPPNSELTEEADRNILTPSHYHFYCPDCPATPEDVL